MSETVVTRVPPSPTGHTHIGTARMALFNYLFAKQNGGKVLLRMEDTDRERSKPEFEEEIKADLEWLGLSFDEFSRQSERGDVYKKYLEQLIAEDKAYVSKETEGERSEVIRLRNPGSKIQFADLVRGEIEFDTTEHGDFVIARSLDDALYHLAVVVDDHEMGVTHVIRGEDGLNNTARQILIQEAIGAKRPVYAHFPFILGTDGKKLSKRHGHTSILAYREQGYSPEAMLNFMALLGWHPEGEQEIFSLDELVKEFDLSRMQKGGAVFDIDKLDWVSKEHIKKMSAKDQYDTIRGYLSDNYSDELLSKLTPVIVERINKWGDISEMEAAGELGYFLSAPSPSSELAVGKNDSGEVKTHLEKLAELLAGSENFTPEAVKGAVWDYASEVGRGAVLWPMRVALTGLEKSPDPFTVASILGKEETLERLQAAHNIL